MNRIRIGNQSACSAASLMEPFEYAVANHFDAFEWLPDKRVPGRGWDEDDIDANTRDFIKKISEDSDIALSVHSTLEGNPLKPETHSAIFRSIYLAIDIGAGVVNIHLQEEEGIEAYVRSILPFIRKTSESDIKLAIENTPRSSPEDFNSLFRYLDTVKAVPTAHVGICFDLGHANLHASTRNDYLGFVKRLEYRNRIIHVHMHENYGDSDSHLTVFTGASANDESGIREFMGSLKDNMFSGSVILEQWPEPPSLLVEARKRLYHIWDSIRRENQ